MFSIIVVVPIFENYSYITSTKRKDLSIKEKKVHYILINLKMFSKRSYFNFESYPAYIKNNFENLIQIYEK